MRIDRLIKTIENADTVMDNGEIVKVKKAYRDEINMIHDFIDKAKAIMKVTAAYKTVYDDIVEKRDGYYEVESNWYEKGTFGYSLCEYIEKWERSLDED